MLVFSNYENFSVTKQDIDELQTKLNNYSGSMESLIGAIDSFVANNYITGTYNVGDYNQDLIDLSMVNNLSANNCDGNAGNIEELKDSMDIINEKMNEYKLKKKN